MVYAYDDETKSTSWSNFPVTFVQRAGLNLAELTEEQQDAALEVLEALLNDEGYATVVAIMGGDEYLHEYRTSTEASLGRAFLWWRPVRGIGLCYAIPMRARLLGGDTARTRHGLSRRDHRLLPGELDV